VAGDAAAETLALRARVRGMVSGWRQERGTGDDRRWLAIAAVRSSLSATQQQQLQGRQNRPVRVGRNPKPEADLNQFN